jgi:hypothetical protein
MNPIIIFKNSAIRPLRALMRKILGTSLFGPPVSCLVPENLYAYLDAVYKKRKLKGTILEVGCASGATAAIAYTFLARQGLHKATPVSTHFKGLCQLISKLIGDLDCHLRTNLNSLTLVKT